MLDILSIQQILTLLCGSAGFIASGFLFCVIIRFKDLHFNAYYLTAALAITDMLNGIAFLSSGSYTLYLIYSGEADVLIPTWKCVFVPQANLFPIAYHSGSMMILLIACDRLLSVTALEFYFSLGNKYTMGLISFCILYTLGTWSYFTYDLMADIPENATTTKFCWDDLNSESVHLYDFYATTSFVTGAVLIMIATLIILHRKAKSSVQASAEARNIQAARLLAKISFNTFSMWAVPEIIVNFIVDYDWFFDYGIFLYLLQPLHAVVNLAIYFRKGSQMRQAYSSSPVHPF